MSLASIVDRAKQISAPVRKLLGSVLGGATGVGVTAILEGFGVHLDGSVASAIALVLAAVGTYIAPQNVTEPGDTSNMSG